MERPTYSAGDVVGETYRIERLLGRGGMAEVYEVRHTRMGRRFALKLLRPFDRTGPAGPGRQAVQRFTREAAILGGLRHPHIVDVADWNHGPSGEPYLVMELLVGEELHRFLRRSGPLPPVVALPIVAEIGQALAAAHRVGVVHRDLKPSNVFLCEGGVHPRFVKVLDFGVARLMGDAGRRRPLTAGEQLLGTPGYMAPEQARGGAAEADGRADQFALGAILYEMLAGRPAFFVPGHREPLLATLERVLRDPPPPLPPSVPPSLQLAVERALAKRPERRYPSIEAFLQAIDPPAAPPALAPPSSSPVEGRPPALTLVSRQRFVLASVLVAAAVALGVWAWLTLS